MDEVMKTFLENLIKDGKIHTVQKDNESKKGENLDFIIADVKKDATEIASLNRILYDAHIEAGFTSEEALALVIAENN